MNRVFKGEDAREGLIYGVEAIIKRQEEEGQGVVYAASYGSLQAAIDAAFLEAPARRSTGRVCTW